MCALSHILRQVANATFDAYFFHVYSYYVMRAHEQSIQYKRPKVFQLSKRCIRGFSVML